MLQLVTAPPDGLARFVRMIGLHLFKKCQFVLIATGANRTVPDRAIRAFLSDVKGRCHRGLIHIKDVFSRAAYPGNMTELDVFRKHGLFDKRVPRYTSYPPANRFEAGAGRRLQRGWLSMIDGQTPLSIYVHIPFCRRLCWFCACRTQGTATRAPIDGYLDSLFREIETSLTRYVAVRAWRGCIWVAARLRSCRRRKCRG